MVNVIILKIVTENRFEFMRVQTLPLRFHFSCPCMQETFVMCIRDGICMVPSIVVQRSVVRVTCAMQENPIRIFKRSCDCGRTYCFLAVLSVTAWSDFLIDGRLSIQGSVQVTNNLAWYCVGLGPEGYGVIIICCPSGTVS